MAERIVVVGAPSSAGAYAPGQEQTPQALRAAGLLDKLRARGIAVEDAGDTDLVRWRADRENRFAMNARAVARSATQVADRVRKALTTPDSAVLVLGGDCTIELGTIAGAVSARDRVGLVYIDHDTDLNTPTSTTEGALDWMGVAHMLALPDTVSEVAGIGPRVPLLAPEQVLLFADASSTAFERGVIDDLEIAEVPHETVQDDPAGAARGVVEGWAAQFDHLLVHLDIDVVDFADAPLAENTRRNTGITLDTLVAALEVLIAAPNWCGLTVTEVNPDHGEPDGSTMEHLATTLAEVIAGRVRSIHPGG